MRFVSAVFRFLLAGLPAGTVLAQNPGALKVFPNLAANIDRPLRYRPDGADFVIDNGREFFNRPLYGGNTAFRVDGGDKPEFVLYLPGRGGNLRLGVRTASGAKWLHDAAGIKTWYRPGELRYEIRDPLLGANGVLRCVAVAYAETEGLCVRVEAEGLSGGSAASDGANRAERKAGGEGGVDLVWAYGGVNGQRGVRDGDIGTERVPISEWFQLKPEFCTGNAIEFGIGRFTVRAKPATIVGVMPVAAGLRVSDAASWADPLALLDAPNVLAPLHPVLVGRVKLGNHQPQFLSLQRVGAEVRPPDDLATYREVTVPKAKKERPTATLPLAPTFPTEDVPERFAAAERHFAALRERVAVDTPDPFFNAAVGALNVAADAVWDEPQQDIMHGAIAWRTRLLGWRGPYALDALGWHDRARKHFEYWAGRQNTEPIPDKVPPPDEKTNLARNEAGLHTNGDMSNSHYDMNLVYIDALFRHLMWTGDREFAKRMWPVIERHLAWERRLFRREFGPDKLPLYEAYAAIWASDDLQYSGGGAMHASAYNYFHNQQAARLARWIGMDPTPYQREAQQLERAMRDLLWVGPASGVSMQRGWFGEAKDWLGLRRVHPAAALWTFYHTMDSEVPTAQEAWLMTGQVERDIPHLPVRGEGVPAGLYTLGTSNWLPYDWSINNVVMGEAVHAALGFWQAGRADEAWKIMEGSVVAAMFMGISPGNVGSMSYLDVYRRESQRDFADGSGVLSRAIVEGVFGIKPDAPAGELGITPGWPAGWEHAAIRHPDFAVTYKRDGATDLYTIEQAAARPLNVRLRLRARRDRVQAATVDGTTVPWHVLENAVGAPQIEILAPVAARREIRIAWAGEVPRKKMGATFARAEQGQMRWWQPPVDNAAEGGRGARAHRSHLNHTSNERCEPVDLASAFNDRVTQIFKNEYRAPRSPFVSLALPKQGLGGWAGGVNATADIDDGGLRATAANNGGKITLPNGVPLLTPTPAGAKNVMFVSQWENYPHERTIALQGRARGVVLLMAGSTGPMQSRFENGEVVVSYADGTSDTLSLRNPENWWPIEQDYFIDDYQFRVDESEPPPVRVDLKTGQVRTLRWQDFKGHGGRIAGGAATVVELGLHPERQLKSLTVRATANDVVIGLMAATLVH